MGYEVKNYDLGEIIELKERGDIIPSLFWAIPIGKWEGGDLQSLWHRFTKSYEENLCKSVGLLLVKELRESRFASQKKKDLDLAPLTASLKEIFPKKYQLYEGHEYKGILIVSGDYPQPGWGVVINLTKTNNSDFLSQVEAVLNMPKINPIVTSSKEASTAYLEYKRILEEKPQPPMELPFPTDNSYVIVSCVKSLLKFENCYQNLNKFNNLLIDFNESLIPPSINSLNEFKAMCLIRKENNSEEYLRKFIELLQDLPESVPENKQKHLSNEYIKLSASLKHFEESARGEFLNRNKTWFERVNEDYVNYFSQVIDKIYSINGNIQTNFNNESDQFHEKLSHWIIKKDKALLQYRQKLNNLIEIQWYGGPEFLISIQKTFGTNASTISWDEVRMVGWKITASLQDIEVSDLAYKINQIFNVNIEKDNLIKNSKLDGSYFSDLLHYIVETDRDTFFDKREITKKIITELLRHSEIKEIFSFHKIFSDDDAYDAEELVMKLGWKNKPKPYSVSLDSFFENIDNSQRLKKNIDGNQVRTCLESYTKDIIHVIVSNLEKQNEDLYTIIYENFRGFRKTPTGKWKDELSEDCFSLGSAQFIIYALGKEWKPMCECDWKNIASNLIKASDILNDLSHHKEILPLEEEVILILSPVLTQITESVNNILLEMPWHFYPQIVRGEFPSILTGRAWSHSYKEEKTVRILNWEGNDDLSPSLVWNPTKRNPIMTECKIIKKMS